MVRFRTLYLSGRLVLVVLLAEGLVSAAHSEAKRPTRFDDMEFAQRKAVLEQTHREESLLPNRLLKLSRAFLNTPYVLSPLGEAKGVDPDPRFRIDAFDCTTFVETAMVLAYRNDWSKAADLLDRLRYNHNKIDFNHRRHLITADWIPKLQKEGVLSDITAQIAGNSARNIKLNLSKNRWRKRRIARSLNVPEQQIPFGSYSLPIIPLQALGKKAKQIPSGTLVNVVRLPSRYSPVIVTHQGLFFRDEKGRQFIRHASPVAKRVIDEPLSNMIRRYRKPRKWGVAGINIQAINSLEYLEELTDAQTQR